MATASAVLAVVERLDYLLLAKGAPARCIGDLKDGVEHLQSDLRGIVPAPDSIDSMSENLKKMVRQLAYDIEDAVESYAQQEVAHQGKSGVLRCLFNCSSSTARKLKEDVHIFKGRIDEIKLYNMDAPAGGGGGGCSSSSISALPDAAQQPHEHLVPAETTSHMQQDKEYLKSHLVSGSSDLSIIAICGMGGIGKTTLARSLFDDPLVVKRFSIRAWTCVSEQFDARDTLKDILSFLRPGSISKNTAIETMELMELLYMNLKQKRYLVVLDDVRSTEVWDSLEIAFPDDRNGSKIVITTRAENLARYLGATVHRMRPLSYKESWEVFKMNLKDRGNGLDPDTERIGMKIVEQCRGLPLAIATISNALRRMDRRDWRRVLIELQGTQNLALEEDSLAVSYHNLPFYLKPCLLYLGHFPPDQAIPVDKLYLLWMAEGLILAREPSDKWEMEAAEDYLEELFYRSLVIVEEMEPMVSSVRFKSCCIHDLIREVCIREGKQDDFFEIIDLKGRSSLSHRLAIYLHKYRDTNSPLAIPAENRHIIRSILFYDTDNKSLSSSTWPKELSDLKDFQRTRVLDFNKVDFQIRKLPRGIDGLTYLRYLSFAGCYLPEFPASLSNFPLLETLDLRVRDSCIMTIPNVLRKLSNLRHLYFPQAYRSDTNDKLKLGSLKKLKILENFHAGICDADDLPELKNLEIFTGTVDGNNIDLKKTMSSLNGMKSPRHCSLVVKAFDSYSKERRSIVAELLECNAIHSLNIEGYLGVFPLDKGIGSNFTEMIFNGSEFGGDSKSNLDPSEDSKSNPMPILGKLPNLRSLVLCNDAFIGTKLICSGDFPSLTSFKLATLQFLKNLEVTPGAMPNLAIFTVDQCDKLETLPSELKDRAHSRKLEIVGMPEELPKKVNKLVEEVGMERGCRSDLL